MYTKIKNKISDHEVLTYKNAQSGNAFSIIPGYGALITSIIIGDRELLDGADLSETGENPAFKGSLLAPFANRVNHGTYSFLGRTYHLPVNEKANDNALHGFLYKQKFEVTEETLTLKNVHIKLESFYKGGHPGYPFPFLTNFTVEMDEKEGLTCTLEFKNTGNTDLPLVAGWHPYYSLGAHVDQLQLKLPEGEIIEVDSRMIPAGRLSEYTDFSTLAPIGNKRFDNIFRLKNKSQRAKIILKNPENGITLEAWQESNMFGYWVIYTPPSRKSIAVEPMSGSIDAFNNGEGLIIIKPGGTVVGKFGVSLID